MNGLALSSPRQTARLSLHTRGASFCLAVLATAIVLLVLLSLGSAPPLLKGAGQPRIVAFDIAPPLPVTPLPVPPPPPTAPPEVPKQQSDRARQNRPPASKAAADRSDAVPAPLQSVDVTPSLVSTADLGRLITAPGSGKGGSNDGGGKYGDGTGGDGGNVRGDGQGIVLKIARWVWRPTVADLAPFNPRVATDAHIVGDVLLVCRVRLNRHVHGCRVLAERPSGYELGAAAIAASHIFRVWPTKQAGKAIDDAWVVVPAHYDFADPKH